MAQQRYVITGFVIDEDTYDFKDTTTGNATTTESGFMSAADKVSLDDVVQVISNMYTKTQVDALVAQSTAKTEFTGTLSLAAGVTLINFSARKVAGIVYIRGVVQKSLTLGGWNELFILPEGYRPKEDFYTVFLNGTSDKAIETRITATGVAYVYPVSDTASASASNIAFSVTFIQ